MANRTQNPEPIMRLNAIGRFSVIVALTVAGAGLAYAVADDRSHAALYAKWVTGRMQLIDAKQAKEFETIFRHPLHGPLPKLADVAMIYGELETRQTSREHHSFKVPVQYHAKIYKALEPHGIDTQPVFEGYEAGSLKIYTHNGAMTRVCWYPMRVKNGKLWLSIHGIRFVASTRQSDDHTDLGQEFTNLIERARVDAHRVSD